MRRLPQLFPLAALAGVVFHTALQVSAPEIAMAQPMPVEPSARHTVVMLVPGTSEKMPCAAELEAVQNQLAELPATVEFTPLDPHISQTDEILEVASRIAEARGAALVFWMPFSHKQATPPLSVCSSANRVYLFIPDFEGGRFLVRELGHGPSGSDAEREALGLIVRSTLRTSLLGDPLDDTPEITQSALERQAPPSDLTKDWRIYLFADYGLWGLSDAIPLGHGARLGLGISGSVLFAGLGWRLNPPNQARWSELSFERRSGGPEVYAGFGLGRRARLEVLSFFFVERTEFKVVDAPEIAQVSTASDRWAPALGAGVGLSLPAGSRIRLHALAGVDVPWERQRYVVQKDNSTQNVFHGWLVRPMVRIGGCFDILSAGSVQK